MQRNYRGQRTDTKEWIYGYFVKAWDETCYIITEFGTDVTCCDECGANDITACEVIPETVGQDTGLKDKRGNIPFESDVIYHEDKVGIIRLGRFGPRNQALGFYVEWVNENDNVNLRHDLIYWTEKEESVIVGNIHDNPELLQEVSNV